MAAAWNTWHIVRRTHQSASNQNSNYEKSKSKQNLQNAINENEIIELSPMNNKTVGSHWIARFGWLVDIRSNFHWISCVQVFSCFPSRYECKTGPSGELEGTFSIKRSQRINGGNYINSLSIFIRVFASKYLPMYFQSFWCAIWLFRLDNSFSLYHLNIIGPATIYTKFISNAHFDGFQPKHKRFAVWQSRQLQTLKWVSDICIMRCV